MRSTPMIRSITLLLCLGPLTTKVKQSNGYHNDREQDYQNLNDNRQLKGLLLWFLNLANARTWVLRILRVLVAEISLLALRLLTIGIIFTPV